MKHTTRLTPQRRSGLQTLKGALQRLSMTLLLVMLSATTVWADDASGTYGDNLEWAFTESDSTLTISGTGEITDNAPWSSYKDQIKTVTLSEGISSIGTSAFSDAVNLQKITIPASVEKIESYAFEKVGSALDAGCTLTVVQGSKLETIKVDAFSGFMGNTDLRECTSLTTIYTGVFNEYKNGVISLPVSLKTISANAFKGANPSKISVAYKNCVLYVSGTYKGVNLGTEYKELNIKTTIAPMASGSKKVELYCVSFDEIAMSFDEKDKTYVISSEQGLIDLGMKMCAQEVTENCKNLKFKLSADLDFTGMPLDCKDKKETGVGNFMPIGKMLSKAFSYPFDGQGHSIKGLRYDGGSDIGLFFSIGSSATVQNLTLIAPSFSGDKHIGGIVGENSSGTITNCTVIAPSFNGESILGGIVGYNNGNVENCNVIKPSISGTGSYIGCIVGRNRSAEDIKKCLYDISTGLYIDGYKSSAPAIYSTAYGNKPVFHLNLGYGITSNDAITVRDYTMAQLYDRVRLDAYRAGYDLVEYKSEEAAINDGLFEMPKTNVSVTAVWEPMNEIYMKASLIDGANWTTFYCGDAGYCINSDENAYTATVGDDVITLHLLGKVIPKGTAVIIVSDDYDINMTRDDVSAPEYKVKNDLRGVDMPTARTTLTSDDAETLYMLSNKNDHFGFHEFGGANVPARKAYFTVSSEADSRSFNMEFEDDADGISSLTPAPSTRRGEVYDLSGRKINSQLKSGLYIINGKKVII